jgi:hypothetical protein
MDILGIPLERAVAEMKARGISIEDIKYTKPFKNNQECLREVVVRIDSIDDKKVKLIVALFPVLNSQAKNI